MKNQQGGGTLPLAPTLRFSATPSAGAPPQRPRCCHTDSILLTQNQKTE